MERKWLWILVEVNRFLSPSLFKGHKLVVGVVWLLRNEASNLLKCELGDVKMSYEFLTVVLGKDWKFYIPEKGIISQKEIKNLVLKWRSDQNEWSHHLIAAKMFKPNGALIWSEQTKKKKKKK